MTALTSPKGMSEATWGDEERIVLPWPTSTNALYVAVGGKRFPSKEYKAWKREAGWTLLAQHPRKFRCPVKLRIELHPPHSRRFDLDNRTKSIQDLLVEHQIIRDDSSGFIRSLEVVRVDTGAPCTVILTGVA